MNSLNPLNLVFGFKGVAVTAAATAAVAAYGGWKAKTLVVEASHARELKRAQEAHTEALEALQEELDAEAAETVRLAALLDAEQANVRTVTREIIREVPHVVQDSTPDCDRRIGVDTLRLLDRAALGATPGPGPAVSAPGERADTLSGGVAPTGYPRPR